MLIMRFNRTGKKNRVSYRIVLQEHTTAPGKRHVEILGSYDPHSKNAVLKNERIQYWLKEGVQTSDAVHNLLVGQGLIQGQKRAKKMPRPLEKKPAQEKEAENPEPAAAEREKNEVEPTAETEEVISESENVTESETVKAQEEPTAKE